MMEAEGRIKGTCEDAMLLALKTEKGTIHHRMQPLDTGKSKATDSTLEPLEGIQPHQHLDIWTSVLTCRTVRFYVYVV